MSKLIFLKCPHCGKSISRSIDKTQKYINCGYCKKQISVKNVGNENDN